MANRSSAISWIAVLLFVSTAARADLVRHWRMDETAGLVAVDATGGVDGTLVNFEENDDTQWVSGEFNGALDLGAGFTTNNYVSVNLPPVQAATTGGFTIALWVSPGDFVLSPGEYQLVSTPGDAIGLTIMNNFFDGRNVDRVPLFWDGSAAEIIVGTTPLESGEWYHVAITSTGVGGVKQMYINGEPELTELLLPTQGGTGIGVRGGWNGGAGQLGAFNGPNRAHDSLIDDVRIYDEALDGDAIRDIVEGPPPSIPPTITLVVPAPRELFHDSAVAVQLVIDAAEDGGTLAPADVGAVLNGIDVTGSLEFEGNQTALTVRLTGLASDTLYRLDVSARDSLGVEATRQFLFGTFQPENAPALVHHFRFDEPQGLAALDLAGGVVGDLAGFENDDDSQWIDGQIDGALHLGVDATRDNSVTFPISRVSAFDTGGFTVALWVRAGTAISSPGEYQLLSTPGDAVGLTLMNNVFEGRLVDRVPLFWDGSAAEIIVGTTPLEPGTWHHIAITSQGAGGEKRLYLDGRPETTELLLPSQGGSGTAVSDGWDAGMAQIGAFNGTFRAHDSAIDDVRIYGVALEADEIEELVGAVPPTIVLSDPNPREVFHIAGDGLEVLVEAASGGGTIATSDIAVSLNGVDVSADLTFGGDERARVARYEGLAEETRYRLDVTARDSLGSETSRRFVFGTFTPEDEEGLVHHFRLDETDGLQAFDLASGTVGDLIDFENDDDSQWIPGVVAGALDLGADGTPANSVTFQVERVNAFDTGGYTVALWVRPGDAITAPGEYQLLSTPGDGVGLTLMNNTFEGRLVDRVPLFWDGSAAEIIVGTTPLDPGTWYHVAITSFGFGGEKRMYLDGQPETTELLLPSQGGLGTAVSDGWDAGAAQIGAFNGAFRTHDSAVDDVRIYNIALDEEEIEALVAPPPPPGTPYVRGDANSDGVANISDAQFILNFLFLGGPPLGCNVAGDANSDGSTNISDAQYILNFLFLGGPGIAPPASCGDTPLAPPEVDCTPPEVCT